MVAKDQPTIFPASVIANISSVADGNMKFAHNDHAAVERNITAFIQGIGILPDTVNYQGVDYDKSKFTDYKTLGHPAKAFVETTADGIATNTKGAALFLPLADCTGAIFYDPVHHAVMISHLGRHSTEQKGALASIQFMEWEYRSKPSDILVWLGPSPNGGVYPLWARGNMSLIEANRLDLIEAGVAPGHIEASPIDTARDTNYYSHSEFLKGHRTEDGRFAIVAQLL